MKIAKHSAEAQKIRELEKEKQELLAIVSRKDKEIKDIKTECAEQFKNIKDLCFINDYSDNFSALVKDIAIDETDEDRMAKIIKLPTTNQSDR